LTFLEAVEIHAQHRELVLGHRRQVDGRAQALVESGAVGQIGERVVVRHVRDALLAALAVGDVVDDADEVLRLAVLAHHRRREAVTMRVAVAGGDDDVIVEEQRLFRLD